MNESGASNAVCSFNLKCLCENLHLRKSSAESWVFLPFLSRINVALSSLKFFLHPDGAPRHHCQCLPLEHLPRMKYRGWRPGCQSSRSLVYMLDAKFRLWSFFPKTKASHAQNMTPAAPAALHDKGYILQKPVV